MKIMKTINKTILIMAAIFTATLFSCSSDDDGGTTTVVDPIVGKWNLTSRIVNDEAQQLDDCDLKDFLIFKNDNSFEEVLNEDSGTGDNCTAYNDAGTWKKIEENKYTGLYSNDDYIINWELSEDGKTLTDIEEDENYSRLLIYTKE